MKLHDAATLDLPELVEELVSRTAAQMYEAISGDEMTVAEAEERVVELCRALGREILSAGLSERYGRQQGPRRPCECGDEQRFEGYRTRTIMTLLGPIEYERAYYRCPVCRTSRYLGEDTIGVDEYGCSLPAQEAMALVGCELPFRCARDLLMRLTGLDVSTSVVRRVTEEHGARVERAAVREREALFAGELELLPEGAPQRLYVTLDGLQMPFVGDWHETKIGAVYEARVGEDGVDEPVASTYVCGAWEGAEQFGERLYQEASRRGVERAGEVVVIADGAVWIWHLVAEHFPGAVQILDFFHAAERLHEVGRAVYGEGASPARQWAEANKERLWQGRKWAEPPGGWRILPVVRSAELVGELHRRRYRILGELPLLQADRWPWADAALPLAYLGALLLLLGLLITHLWGWRLEGVLVRNGTRMTLPGTTEWVVVDRTGRRTAHSPGLVVFIEREALEGVVENDTLEQEVSVRRGHHLEPAVGGEGPQKRVGERRLQAIFFGQILECLDSDGLVLGVERAVCGVAAPGEARNRHHGGACQPEQGCDGARHEAARFPWRTRSAARTSMTGLSSSH